MIRRAAIVLGLALAVLAVALATGTLNHRSRQLRVLAIARLAIDETAVTQRLSGAVRIRTISGAAAASESRAEFVRFRDYLASAFPRVHAVLRREVVGDYSLLYTWPGSDPTARPVLLMAHQDVVPVAPDTEASWHVPPFAGTVDSEYVWGRGTWDDKGNLMAILEAAELLAADGFRPRRTIYLAFGHDEENGGEHGAKAVAALLAARGIRLEFVTDEGLLISDGIVPGLSQAAALVGLAEKGSVTLRLIATATPGHSSMPGPRSAIGSLAAALARLARDPLPAEIAGVPQATLETLAPEMRGLERIALSNLWLTRPLVRVALDQSPATSALLRTTTALTVVRGGEQENVLPGEAVALVNLRLMPGDRVQHVVGEVRRVIHDDRIRIEVAPGACEASPVATTNSDGYRLIERTVRELFPGVLVAPALMLGGTDSRHMVPIADNVYRFSPIRARAEDLARFHGTDERISIANYGELIRFYHRLVSRAAGDRSAP